ANVAFAGTLAIEIASLGCSDCLLSYLPLSHIAEQIFSLYGPLTAGSAIYFAESIDHVPANLREVRPTVFFGVPRIWEKFHAAIAAKLATAGGARKRVAAWALGVGQRASAYKMRGERLPLALEAQYRVANKVFFLRLKQAIGLDRGRLFVSGAAPIAREILEFFAALDIVVHEGYGQSENAGGTSINRPGRVKLGSVGGALPGVEAKIADDGEILARGPNVFLGYYKDPAATADALVEGWRHSGALGVIAGARTHLTALVTLDAEAGARFREERGLDRGRPLHTDPAVVSEVERALDAVNADMARVEQVKKFVILPSPFSIETGEL